MTSGLQVLYLKIAEPKLPYPRLPLFELTSQTGDYALRSGCDQARAVAPVY